MLKALFLDMDETLCDTTAANLHALQQFAQAVRDNFSASIDTTMLCQHFLRGIYKEWSAQERLKYQGLRQEHGEGVYRQRLVLDLLAAQGLTGTTEQADTLLSTFEQSRMAAFDFYPGIAEFLVNIRPSLTLVVITNGPEFSQLPKLKAVSMPTYVDHIIVGGREPEQKPAASIFAKALELADCSAEETMHFGDSQAADIAGANRCGITSVWIKHSQTLDNSPESQPSHTLAHPSEIPDFVHKFTAPA